MGGCGCDYSYTCPEHQAKIDAENQKDYIEELKQWQADCIVEIAKKLGIDLPPPPKRRW